VAFRAPDARRRISILVSLCVLFCAVPLFAQKTPEPPKPAEYDDADGYAVLSTLLSRAHSDADPNFLLSPFQISPLTASGINPDSFQTCGSKIPAEFAAAATDFRGRNKQIWTVTKKLNLKFNYKFTNLEGKRTRLLTQNDKDVPPALFETSVYQVSAVGFDPSRTHAIAYVAAVCGPGCASGSYHLLIKGKEGWIETSGSPVCQWMSFNLDSVFGRSAS
jgi:hypothetical protein